MTSRTATTEDNALVREDSIFVKKVIMKKTFNLQVFTRDPFSLKYSRSTKEYLVEVA